jgi:hypothetical protein
MTTAAVAPRYRRVSQSAHVLMFKNTGYECPFNFLVGASKGVAIITHSARKNERQGGPVNDGFTLGKKQLNFSITGPPCDWPGLWVDMGMILKCCRSAPNLGPRTASRVARA